MDLLEWLKLAKAATGDGSLEERLLRLMKWVAVNVRPVNIENRKHVVDILNSGIGLCFDANKVFCLMVYKLFCLPTRVVRMVHTDGLNGHVVSEVFYSKEWHLFDVSPYQAVFRDSDGSLMSYSELARNSDVVKEQHLAWVSEHDGVGIEGFYISGEISGIIERSGGKKLRS